MHIFQKRFQRVFGRRVSIQEEGTRRVLGGKRGNEAERATEPIIPRYDFRGLARLTVTRGSPLRGGEHLDDLSVNKTVDLLQESRK